MMQANIESISLAHDFSMQVEEIVKNKKIPYIEAVVHWCEINGKEISVGGELVKKSAVIKARVQAEAEDLNLLPKGVRLPL